MLHTDFSMFKPNANRSCSRSASKRTLDFPRSSWALWIRGRQTSKTCECLPLLHRLWCGPISRMSGSRDLWAFRLMMMRRGPRNRTPQVWCRIRFWGNPLRYRYLSHCKRVWRGASFTWSNAKLVLHNLIIGTVSPEYGIILNVLRNAKLLFEKW